MTGETKAFTFVTVRLRVKLRFLNSGVGRGLTFWSGLEGRNHKHSGRDFSVWRWLGLLVFQSTSASLEYFHEK